MSSEMSTDQAIKALQAHNAQFKEIFMNLAKGQEDLKTLILKEKKKKKKKKNVVLLNMGHRFGNRLRHGVNVVDDDAFVTSIEDISTLLMTVKKNLLLAGLFSG